MHTSSWRTLTVLVWFKHQPRMVEHQPKCGLCTKSPNRDSCNMGPVSNHDPSLRKKHRNASRGGSPSPARFWTKRDNGRAERTRQTSDAHHIDGRPHLHLITQLRHRCVNVSLLLWETSCSSANRFGVTRGVGRGSFRVQTPSLCYKSTCKHMILKQIQV